MKHINNVKVVATKKYTEAVIADYRRNTNAFVAWEFAWGLGISFTMFATMVPAYLDELGASKSLIGVMASLGIIPCPLQIIISHYFRNKPRIKWLTCTHIAGVLPWFILSIVLFYIGQSIPTTLHLTLFCISVIFCMSFCVGNGALYFSVITDCTPMKKRGSLFGYRIGAVAVAMLIMYFPARLVMQHWPEPQNFHVAFIIGTAFYIVSCFILLTIREHRDPRISAGSRGSVRVNGLIVQTRVVIRKMLRNPNYKVFLFFNIMFIVALTSASFLIVFAKELLELKGSDIPTFSIIQMTSSAVFAIIFGLLADKIGYRIIGIIQGIILMIAFLIVTLMAHGVNMFGGMIYVAFSLYASVVMVAGMVMTNMSVELLPKQNSGTLIAAANLLMMPIILFTNPFAGWIVDKTGSYVIIFAIGSIISAISALGFWLLVREPRTRKIYIIRHIRWG